MNFFLHILPLFNRLHTFPKIGFLCTAGNATLVCRKEVEREHGGVGWNSFRSSKAHTAASRQVKEIGGGTNGHYPTVQKEQARGLVRLLLLWFCKSGGGDFCKSCTFFSHTPNSSACEIQTASYVRGEWQELWWIGRVFRGNQKRVWGLATAENLLNSSEIIWFSRMNSLVVHVIFIKGQNNIIHCYFFSS